jgi:hypothetical protein
VRKIGYSAGRMLATLVVEGQYFSQKFCLMPLTARLISSEDAIMTKIRESILSIALLMLVATTSAFAQNQTPSQTEAKPAATLTTKMENISSWSKQQWYAAKAKWIKEKVKWANCQSQAIEKKLSGRKSWPFLYNCMTKSS